MASVTHTRHGKVRKRAKREEHKRLGTWKCVYKSEKSDEKVQGVRKDLEILKDKITHKKILSQFFKKIFI